MQDFLDDEDDYDDYAGLDYEEDYHDDAWYVDYEDYPEEDNEPLVTLMASRDSKLWNKALACLEYILPASEEFSSESKSLSNMSSSLNFDFWFLKLILKELFTLKHFSHFEAEFR